MQACVLECVKLYDLTNINLGDLCDFQLHFKLFVMVSEKVVVHDG